MWHRSSTSKRSPYRRPVPHEANGPRNRGHSSQRSTKSGSLQFADARTVQSTPESGAHAGYDGHKRRKGAKVQVGVDTLGHLLAAAVTPASEQERAQVADLAEQVQTVTGDRVELAYVDQGYTSTEPAEAAAEHGIQLEVIKLPEAQGPRQGVVLLPKRWVVERSFAWLARFRRLARDYERLPQTVAGLTFLAFTGLMLSQLIHWPFSS